MVEFVFMDFELAEMAPAQLAGHEHSGNWCKPTQNDKINVVTINWVLNLNFALTQ